MRTLRHTLAVLLTALMAVSSALAQDITVTVTPTQQVLPPQLMLYVTEPGNYFNISISNTGITNENIYLVMQIEQVNPASGLGLSTPTNRQPRVPIVVPATSTRILSPAEIRSLFNHIPLNEFKAPAGIFDNYADGSFGLLPEGQYELHFTAYHWDLNAEPYVVSNPTGGVAHFDICYKAQAPQFLTPMAVGENAMDPLSVAVMDPLSPQFTWQAPVIACNPALIQYNYSLRVVEMLPGQMPDESMDNNPVVYQISSLTTPMCMIPQHVVTMMQSSKTYAAQVTATPASSNNKMLNYVSIENKGKSTYKLFRIKATEKVGNEEEQKPKVPEVEEAKDDGKGEKGEEKDGKGKEEEAQNEDKGEKDEDEEDDITIVMGNVEGSGIVEDSLYTFGNPKIVEPFFLDGNGARKRFVETSIDVSWEAPLYKGGEGQRNDTIQIEYEVQLFNNGERADREDALQQEPIYTFRTREQKDSIPWDTIADKVEAGDYLLIRVNPIVTKGHSVAFTGDENLIDFALVNHLSQRYFQCSSTTEIENTKPTSKSASDIKGKEFSIGEYMLTIDEATGNGTDGFTGKGRVKWEPFGHKVMICVKFDKLKINIDDVVYEGICESYAGPQVTDMEAVDKLFSDWGIDNLISDSGLPYANMLQNKATGAVKSLAEQVDLGKYYKAYQDGKNLYKFVTGEDLDQVYMPIGFPMEILPKGWDVVDIQIAGMKFAPTYATMNIIGQSILPECDVLKSKILVFGAPRVCISPKRFLPESGHIALLGDFTLAPSSNFEITFKAPKDVMEPKDGCYISWHADTLELLGIDADMKVAGIVKDVNGKATTERPVINLQASFGSWSDFMVDNISIDDFQVEDLPGWTFTAKNIVYDHSIKRNSQHMGAFPERYSKTKAGIKGNDESWQGLHIGEIGIKFPTSLEIGEGSDDEEKRLSIKGEEMFFDNNITLKMEAENIFSAKEGKMGGWGISLDKAQLQIIQDDFDNCMFSGQLNIPLFGSKEKKKDDKGKEKFGNVDYTCEIRRLTDPRPRSALTEQINPVDLQKTRYSYVFLTEQVDDLNFDCFVAQVDLDHKQTYFLIEAYDDEKEDKTNTQVELCLGGTIGIGGVDEANEWLKKKTESLPLELKIPDIHFTKMRLSNVKRAEWVSISELAANKRKEREARELEVEKELKKSMLYYKIAESEEMELGESFYLDLGEWSLASAKKRLGPFSFNLDKFKPSFSNNNLQLEVGGTIGLLEDKINVGAAVIISAKVDMPGIDISKWSISEGDVKFDSLGLDLDFTALHLKGGLKVVEDGTEKGYRGDLDIDITGLFSLKCNGGYFEHEPDAESEAGMKEDGVDTKTLDEGDKKYSWGYFMVRVESSTGIRIDPIVINRISGGFFFNCRPTKGKDDKTDKFGGTPEPFYGNIGVALGMTLSSSAGEKTLSANMDLLVCYDKKNKCLSTFMFNGDLKAVGGIIKADASLIYENQKNQAGVTQNRYLCLNVTVEAGADTKALIADVTKANAALESLKEQMDKFQANVDDIANKMVTNPMQGLKQLSGEYKDEDKQKDVAEDDTEDKNVTEKDKDAKNELGAEAMKTKISLEFKITWVEDGQEYNTPKWHLYLGEPAKDKRCSFTFLKFDGKIVKVDIGADAYLCLGNELPDNGALPPIPSKITEFLSGHKSGSTDMGADLSKADRSRKRAAQALLGNDVNGGVMVGASAWGYISIDLGLLYGSLDAIAGFDCSLINYGSSAFCVNSGSAMGKDGWYAMGQFYAYLAAELGIHVKIGSFINEKIKIFEAGIGGVLEIGLPNPTWVEGQARIKISLLGGLCKINKKFEFSAGDHCVPFKGNALDGFEMFQDVSLGSDSLYQALMDPTFAISASDANNMTFTTTSSIGSHYRLLDPSWASELADRDESQSEEDVQERIASNASRTYVFDIDQNLNKNNMKMGVRLFDLGTKPTEWATAEKKMSESDFYFNFPRRAENAAASVVGLLYQDRGKTVSETSIVMKGKDLSKGEDYPLSIIDGSGNIQYNNAIDYYLNDTYDIDVMKSAVNERNVSFRESKGTMFHLTGMNLEPGHSYVLFLMADAYEIDNGKRVWCSYVDEKEKKERRIHWKQTKAWFFRVKSDEENKILTDSIRDLEPYIALAYPSTNGSRVVDTRGEGIIPAYYGDIMHPTIALNRDLQTVLPANKMEWVLTGITAAGDTLAPQTRKAKYIVSGGCINLEPETAFDNVREFISAKNTAANNAKEYDFNSETYHLQLNYTYRKSGYAPKDPRADSTFQLVDLTLTSLPHHIVIDGYSYNDSWRITTQKAVTETLPYSAPFVGARIYAKPVIDYEEDYEKDVSAGLFNLHYTINDEEIVFENKKYSKYNLPYRLIDPYLYFAYLAKWVFIGDREINPYDFDEVGCKFASETLIFNYNGTTVNTEFLKDVKNKSIYEVRNQMYGVWNDWYYNNRNMPQYPLPATTKTVGGLTVNNQDGKASTVKPLYIRKYKDYTYCFEDLVKDYTAVYDVADDICETLRSKTRQLVNSFYYHYSERMKQGKDYGFDKKFNDAIKYYTQINRGRYLEAKSRGYEVRVPYYQLPLIFGDCFGGHAKYNDWEPEAKSRVFSKSIGSDDMWSGDEDNVNLHRRWRSEASNLLFFRLNDRANGTYTYTAEDGTKYTGSIWLRDKDKYNDSYVGGTGTSMHVAWDQFRSDKGLEAVSDFKAYLYRVDAYDMNTGQYVVKNRGGGPWTSTESINADNGTAHNLGEMTAAISDKDYYLFTHYDKPRVQAFMTRKDIDNLEDIYNSTLVFLYSDSIYRTKQQYNGEYIWRVMSDVGLLDEGTWKSEKPYTIKVIIDPSMANVDLRTLDNWFNGFSSVQSITGLSYLNTKNVTSMNHMFYRCSKLTSLNLNDWDTGRVTDMNGMFESCSALKSLYISKLNTKNVTDMRSMFAGCSSLTSLSISDFNTAKVEKMNHMFSGCSELTSLVMPSSTLKLISTQAMFYNCSKLKTINMKAMDGISVQNTKNMFKGCAALTNLYMDNFLPTVTKSACEEMFVDVPNTLRCNINHDLTDYIKDQIPGTKKEVYSDDYKAVYGSINNEDVLIFINNAETYNAGTSYSMRINKRNYTVKVKNVWKGKSVLGSSISSYPSWKVVANNSVKKVFIDENFVQSPSSLYGWFAGCSQLREINGLENLNTSRTTTMAYMFYDCQQLEDISVEKMNTVKVTNMSHMFDNCRHLKEFTSWYSKFIMANVTDASGMFYNCEALEKVIFPSQISSSEKLDDTKNLTNTSYMFAGCSRLKDVTRATYPGHYGVLNTENVTDMECMFDGCKSFANLVYFAPEFNTGKVTNMRAMFRNCSAMEEMSLVGYNTSKVTNMSEMFKGCTSLRSLNLSTFTSEKLTSASSMFQGVPTSCTIYVPFDISNSVLSACPNPPYVNRILVYPAYVIRYKVGGSTELLFLGSKTTLKVGDKYKGYTIDQVWSGTTVMDSHDSYSGAPWNFDYDNPVTRVTIEESFKNVPIINARNYFGFYEKKCTNITGVQYLNMSNAKELKYMFSGYQGTTLDLSQMNTSNATDMSYMFYGCNNLETLRLSSNFKTDNVTDMAMMFSGCNSLKSIDLSSFNTSNVTNMIMMFSGCNSLTSLDLSKVNIGNVKDGYLVGMFGCKNLKTLNLSNFDLSKQTNMLAMFSGCENLESLDLSTADLSHIKYMTSAFDGCTSLRKLVIGSLFSPSNIVKESLFGKDYGAFENVHDLVVVTPADKMDAIKAVFIEKLGFVDGVTGTFYDKEPEKVAQAIWTADNTTLTFYYGVPVGSHFKGEEVTAKWQGDEVLKSTKTPGWVNTVRSTVTTVVFDPSFASMSPTSGYCWFYNFSRLAEIQNLRYLDTSKMTDMTGMFYHCSLLKELDLSNFNTSQVTNMYMMFSWLARVASLDLSKFNTTKVTNMSNMFDNCSMMSSIDLTNFNTTNVTNADNMFANMTRLKTIRLGQNFTFPKLSRKANNCFTNISGATVEVNSKYMSSVKSGVINKLGFIEKEGGKNGEFVEYDKKTAQAIWTSANNTLTFFYGKQYKVGDTFKNGKTVTKVWSGSQVTSTTLDNNYNTPWTTTVKEKLSSVVIDDSFKDVVLYNTKSWFRNCTNLYTVTNPGNLNMSKVTDMSNMFRGCSTLSRLDVSKWDVSSCQQMNATFHDCSSLKTLDVSKWNTASAVYMNYMFHGCTALTSLDVSKWNTSKVYTFTYMFYDCRKLAALDVSKWDTGRSTSMSCMFYKCAALTTLDVSNWNTVNVTNMSYMFSGCSGLTEMNVSNFNTSKVTNMKSMFEECSQLGAIAAGSWDVSKVTDFSYMFYKCSNVWSFVLSRWNTASATNMYSMFYECSRATLIDTDNWNTSKVTNMACMFYNCTKMDSNHMKGWNTTNVKTMNHMFYGCSNMTSFFYGENLNSTVVTTMKAMFYGCTKLRSVSLSSINTVNCTDFTYLFYNCTSLRTLYVSGKFYSNSSKNTSTAFTYDTNVSVRIMNTTNATQNSHKQIVIDTLKKLGFKNKEHGTLQIGNYGKPFDF